MKLIALDGKHFCAGVELDDGGHVYRCAPIINYMRGWSERRVLRFAAERKWTVHVVAVERVGPGGCGSFLSGPAHGPGRSKKIRLFSL